MNINQYHLDALQEIINIGVGQAAGVLNEMLRAHIELNIPFISIFSPESAKEVLEKKLGLDLLSAVKLGFRGSLSGNAELIFPTDSAAKLVSILIDEEFDSPDLDSLKIGALTEVGNIVISGVMGAISNLLVENFDYLLPNYLEGSVEQLFSLTDFSPQDTILLAQTHFTVQKLNIQGDILLIFNLGSFHTLMHKLESIYGSI